jgi:hypothetical protein
MGDGYRQDKKYKYTGQDENSPNARIDFVKINVFLKIMRGVGIVHQSFFPWCSEKRLRTYPAPNTLLPIIAHA